MMESFERHPALWTGGALLLFALVAVALFFGADQNVIDSAHLAAPLVEHVKWIGAFLYIVLYGLGISAVVWSISAFLNLRDLDIRISRGQLNAAVEVLGEALSCAKGQRADTLREGMKQRLAFEERGLQHVISGLTEEDLRSTASVLSVVEAWFSRMRRDIEARLAWLATIAALAPTVGFLGTLIGMVAIFQKQITDGSLNLPGLATGLRLALITSILGLVIRIIAGFLLQGLDGQWDRLYARWRAGVPERLGHRVASVGGSRSSRPVAPERGQS